MKKFSTYTLGVIAVFLLFGGLNSLSESLPDVTSDNATPNEFIASPTPVIESFTNIAPVENINAQPFKDNLALYENDDPTSVVCMYITVRKGNSLENTEYTWDEVNKFDKWIKGPLSANDTVGQAEVIVQFGDENGPIPGELGYDSVVPNGTIQIRGASSSSNPNPKSYKIELFDDAGTWRGQSTFDINKHYYDPTRIRNKLTYDLIKGIPGIVSVRTQFIHLFVRDQTINLENNKYVDYGLFTQVEQINKAFLKNHLLDSNGQLYKATSFEFFRYEDQIRLESDPLFNEEEFSHVLEIKGNRDHSKLIQMLDDVNNYDVPIADTFEKYFDAENYFTWMAINILDGNVDTQTQNFYLYSPENSEKWYFIPWDNDGDFARQRQPETGTIPYLTWEVGFADYWGVVLHNRVLRVEKYRHMLDDKINELSQLMSSAKIESMVKSYRTVVDPFLSRYPDAKQLIINRNQLELSYSLIPSEVENNKKLYFETEKQPMPFYLGTPELSNGKIKFAWDASYSFLPQVITYRFLISKNIAFTEIVFQEDLVESLEIEVPVLKPGAYYWRVIAINEDGSYQYPFDSYYSNTEGFTVRNGGMRYFTITSDGTLGVVE